MERIEWVNAEELENYLDGKGPKPKAVFIEETEDYPEIDVDELDI